MKRRLLVCPAGRPRRRAIWRQSARQLRGRCWGGRGRCLCMASGQGLQVYRVEGNTFEERGSRGWIVSAGARGWAGAIDQTEREGGQADAIDAVGGGGAQRQGQADEGLADIEESVAESDLASGFDDADTTRWSHTRPAAAALGIRPGTGAITRSRHRQREGLVRPVVIVEPAIAIEATLRLEQIAPVMAVPTGPPSTCGGSAHPCLGFGGGTAGRGSRLHPAATATPSGACTPVHCHPHGGPLSHRMLSGRTVKGEDALQSALDSEGLLIRAGLQAQGITRAVIEHGQGMAAALPLQGKVPFEVHLPKLIGLGPAEALHRLMLRRGLFGNATGPAQDAGKRAHRRQGGGDFTQIEQPAMQLARAPGRMLAPQRQHLALDGRRGLLGVRDCDPALDRPMRLHRGRQIAAATCSQSSD